MRTNAIEPTVLSARGRIAHLDLEAAIDAVRDGAYPGWRVVHDEIEVENVGSNNPLRRIYVNSAEVPMRVWTIALVYDPAQGARTVKFGIVGDDAAGLPVWDRL